MTKQRTKLEQPAERRAQAPVQRQRAHPVAWRRAAELAGGDMRRLRVQSDGSVLIVNHR